MASHPGIYYNKKRKEVPPQYFVKEARYHPNGFTVYKVIRRVPERDSFDCFNESFVWKRYSDFRELYKCLATLHRKLYLNGRVPEFSKPKLFGRFEDNVIEERRKSAESVLHFATEHPALLRSAVFKEFFQCLQPVNSATEIKYLKQAPLKPNIREERKSLESDPDFNQSADGTEATISVEDLRLFDPFVSTKEFIDSTSTDQDETWIEQIKRSFSSSQDTDSQKLEKSYQPRELDSGDEAELLEALQVSIGQVDLQDYHNRQKQQSLPNQLKISERSSGVVDKQTGNEGKLIKNMDLGRLCQDADAREKHRKSSKASAYLEAVIKQNELNSANTSVSNSQLPAEDSNESMANEKEPHPEGIRNGSSHLLEKTGFASMPTRSSLLDLPKMFRDESSDDESRGAYVTQAAQQISFARTAEIKLAYEEAFGHYKAAINTLLQGVQGDTNEDRIQAVRRKTANYLQRAEDIHSHYLKSAIDTQDLWKPDSKSSSPRPGVPLPSDIQRTRRDTSSPVPSVPSPRHNSKDLSFYKVLGTVGKVLLVLDSRTNKTHVMKILVKSSQNRLRKGVIPTNVPYMVRLHRYYSTDQAVCLVIEHASGGRLWDQLAPYFDLCKSKQNQYTKLPQKNAERLEKVKGGLCSTPKKIEPQMEDAIKEEKYSTPSFLDVCMEYKVENRNEDECQDSSSQLHGGQSKPLQDGNDNKTKDSSLSKPMPVQRTWSYLSWDDVGTANEDAQINSVEENNDVFDGSNKDNDPQFTEGGWKANFKEISSQGDIKLFTIDPEDDADDFPDESIYDSRSNDDISEEEHEGTVFSRELLSEQDMSAVSLIGESGGKTVPGLEQELGLRSASLSLSRIITESKSSPCLSMNSSFEEERRKNEEDKDSQAEAATVTRVVDENGVSSVDAKTLFRSHSRTKSTTSVTENKCSEKPDLVKDIVVEEQEENDDEGGNKIHSIFVGMDEAKKKSMSYRIPEYTVQRWAAEIVIAVGTLHSIAILCRDLNPNNILLSDDGRIRLSYFGKWRQVERKPCQKLAVKRLYVAPEMSKVHEKKTEACDWWSVGSLLYELLTGLPLYMAHPAGINSHTVLSLPEYLSPEAKSLLTGLLQYYPTQRLGYGLKGLDDLMDHPFFKDTEWDFLIEESNNGS